MPFETQSRPARARGLKLVQHRDEKQGARSRPARARGLKPIKGHGPGVSSGRAPRGRGSLPGGGLRAGLLRSHDDGRRKVSLGTDVVRASRPAACQRPVTA
jgi:hypothetical protein